MLHMCKMEDLEEIACVVHSPVSLSVSSCGDGRSSYEEKGSTTTATASSCPISDWYHSQQVHTPHSGCQVMDVELHQPCSQISIIRFRNHYTYAITVLYQSSVIPEPRALTQHAQDHSNATAARAQNVFKSMKSHGSGPGLVASGKWVWPSISLCRRVTVSHRMHRSGWS